MRCRALRGVSWPGEAGRGRKVNIPARPYLGLSDEDQAEIVSILTRLGPNGFHRGHYASAARIVQEAVTAQALPDFITAPAYDVLNALD